jgi:uncharacterized cupin superfamily protein
MADTRIINLADVSLKDNGNGEAFMAKIARLGPLLGSTGLGCTLTVLPPGKRAFPYHRHHVIDEMFYVLSGAGEYRLDGKRLPLRAGDLIAAPAGKEAHQVVNTSSDELRFLASPPSARLTWWNTRIPGRWPWRPALRTRTS